LWTSYQIELDCQSGGKAITAKTVTNGIGGFVSPVAVLTLEASSSAKKVIDISAHMTISMNLSVDIWYAGSEVRLAV